MDGGFLKSVIKAVITAVVVTLILSIPLKAGLEKGIQSFSEKFQLPIGTIVAWNGQLGYKSLPAGWEICDGKDGRPNLSERFLRGVTDIGQVAQAGGKPILGASLRSSDTGNDHMGVGVGSGEPINVPLNYSVIYIIRVK